MAAVLALTLAAAAGCTAVPAGVDKDLVDEWAMIGEAKVPEPSAGACWTSSATYIDKIVTTPIATTATPCNGPHIIETVHVGHFTGATADADQPPAPDKIAETYTACEAEVTKFLGGSWKAGRVRMLVYPPTATQWRGGARFYRCDVASLKGMLGALEQRAASLQGSLQPGGDRLIGCAAMNGTIDTWKDVTSVVCTAPHDVEFMGVIASKSGTFPQDKDAWKAAYDTACVDQIRSFTNGAINALASAKARYWYAPIAANGQEWGAGNHSGVCYVLLPKKLTRSLKNNGKAAV
ncbi:septum formation family protein [Dactylosporangium sp. NPDC049525]|uniref:septum formation family protein n=1 Tax=Dactylosporangium sp. NPDC049525 TaxID=3154730 RepID=UPI003438BD3C